MKKFLIFLGVIIAVCGIVIAVGCSRYNNAIGPVSNSKEEIEVEITKNDTYSTLGSKLKEKGLINDELMYKIYIKLNKPNNLQVGTYSLSPNQSLEEIIAVLEKGSNYDPNVFNITFREGLNIRQIAELISKNTDIKTDDIYNKLKNKEYLNNLINKYWFLTEDILNPEIYYSLEGYLFPDTYQFSKNATIEDIFGVMLDKMGTILDPYKEKIQSSNYSIHQIMTLASIIELEAGTSDERNMVAGVFYNRIENGWTLGSDVTTYYAARKTFKENLTKEELDDCNAYNTRGTCFAGLPVGPISNPGKQSIEGAINPQDSEYFYFVADKNGKTYFNTTSAGHANTIAELKSKNLWYIYE